MHIESYRYIQVVCVCVFLHVSFRFLDTSLSKAHIEAISFWRCVASGCTQCQELHLVQGQDTSARLHLVAARPSCRFTYQIGFPNLGQWCFASGKGPNQSIFIENTSKYMQWGAAIHPTRSSSTTIINHYPSSSGLLSHSISYQMAIISHPPSLPPSPPGSAAPSAPTPLVALFHRLGGVPASWSDEGRGSKRRWTACDWEMGGWRIDPPLKIFEDEAYFQNEQSAYTMSICDNHWQSI